MEVYLIKPCQIETALALVLYLLQDLASVVAVSNAYCTVENYIDAKYDLHIFKIGNNYRALM